MFADSYRGVVHFGLWAEETVDHYGRRDALEVLRQAAERTAESDQRTPELRAALRYLRGFATRPAIIERFAGALEVNDPTLRAQLAREAYGAIWKPERSGGGYGVHAFITACKHVVMSPCFAA